MRLGEVKGGMLDSGAEKKGGCFLVCYSALPQESLAGFGRGCCREPLALEQHNCM